jgi:hypothetical protein
MHVTVLYVGYSSYFLRYYGLLLIPVVVILYASLLVWITLFNVNMFCYPLSNMF